MTRFGRSSRQDRAGYTIAEAMIAAAITVMGLIGLCVANANCLGMARAHREIVMADQCLQQRTEQFRAANWKQLTDAASVCALLNNPPITNGQLNGQAEQVTINAYPPVIPPPAPIIVTRSTGATSSVLSSLPTGFNLRNVTAVRIDFQEAWTSAQGARTRVRQTSTVIAIGGLLH